ncbi:MAG: bifunctional folylpolyglutamate synthase/dihydrofolate synthase [Desulfamplus sp.]|nr:bifunctional folylpolyglutamate synthase/dihydrofolate synthase [Desulfamplus sp.]
METISYSECLKEMFALGRFGIKLELKTITDILERLGSPQKKFCSIHIAGTNGKGSIASYMASILRSSGFKTGLYTSPHLIKFNERFCINGEMVSDEDVVESFLAVKQADTGERKATFFEISTAMAFYLFAKAGVEWAVIETGMGGRLDATNVLQPAVTVISNLSIEHTEYLGNTLEEIAAEKGGIIKQDTPLVTGVNQESAIAVLNDIAEKKSASVYQYGKEFTVVEVESEMESKSECKMGIGTRFTYKGINVVWQNMETRLSGPHQIQNSALALAASELLIKQNIGDEQHWLTEDSIRRGLAGTIWPGRLEYIMQKPLVLIDGAHNLDAAENLGKYLQKHHASKLTMIIGILKDKPYKEMLQYMLPYANRVIFTRAKIDRSLDPQILKDFSINVMNVDAKVYIIENVEDAVENAIKSTSETDCICIAGSLYVAGEARDKILRDCLKDSVVEA